MALPKNPKVDLKAKYHRTFEIGLIFALSFLILAFKFFPEIERAEVKKQKPQDIAIGVEDIPPSDIQPPPPPELEPDPTNFDIIEDEPLDDYEFKSTEWDENDVVNSPPPPPPIEEDSDEEAIPPFVPFPQILPQPIGGISEIQKNIVYPEIAVRVGMQGKVLIEAKVDENGVVYEAFVLKGIGAGCDEEALRVIKNTRFKPGVQGDKFVRTRVVIPIVFKLN